jgi:hypothetical protein
VQAEVPEHRLGDRLGAAAHWARGDRAPPQVEQGLDAHLAAHHDLERLLVERRDEPQRARALDVVREEREVGLSTLDHLDRGQAAGALERDEFDLGHVALERSREGLAQRQKGSSASAGRDADRAPLPAARGREDHEGERREAGEGVAEPHGPPLLSRCGPEGQADRSRA